AGPRRRTEGQARPEAEGLLARAAAAEPERPTPQRARRACSAARGGPEGEGPAVAAARGGEVAGDPQRGARVVGAAVGDPAGGGVGAARHGAGGRDVLPL